MGVSATITSSSKTGTVATYVAVNTFKVGEPVSVAGLVTNAALNIASPGRQVTAVSGSQFSIGGFGSGTVGSVTETGTATDPFEWIGGDAAGGDQNGDWMPSSSTKYLGQAALTLGTIDLGSFRQAPGPHVTV